jgi:hypothetical protein
MIIEAKDVTEELLRMAEDTFEAWFDNDEPIDWDDDAYGFWARMESDFRIDFGPQIDTPAMRKIQRHIRKYRAQG